MSMVRKLNVLFVTEMSGNEMFPEDLGCNFNLTMLGLIVML